MKFPLFCIGSGHTDLFGLQTTTTALQSSLQKSVMDLYNKNILPLLGKYCTVEYHGHEFTLHVLLRAGPKMPEPVRFLSQSYMQTEDLLKNVTLDIKKNTKSAAPEITEKPNNKIKPNYIINWS